MDEYNQEIVEEVMNLDDSNSIINYGAATSEYIRNLTKALNDTGDNDTYFYDEKYKKLIDRLFSYKTDIDKEVEKQKSLSERIVDEDTRTVLNLFGLIPRIKNSIAGKKDEKIEIRRISVHELKEKKQADLEQLEQEFIDLGRSLESKINDMESKESDAEKSVILLKKLYENGQIQLKEFEVQIEKVNSYEPENEIEKAEKEMLLKRYNGRYLVACDTVTQIGSNYQDFLTNANNREEYKKILRTQLFNIRKALQQFPSLLQYVTMGIEITQAEEVNKNLQYFFDSANEYIQEGSAKLLEGVKKSSEMYLNSGITKKTRMIQQKNIDEIKKITSATASKKQAVLQEQFMEQQKYIGTMESDRLALSSSNKDNGVKTLKLLNKINDTNNDKTNK